MSVKQQVIQVFVAAPGDITEERTVIENAVRDWNTHRGAASHLRAEVVWWKSRARPRMGVRPQEAINTDVLDAADIVVGIFWTRFGTPTGVADSGTAEEIRRSIGAEKDVLLYFCDRPVRPSDMDAAQFAKIQAFKCDIQESHTGLYWEYSDIGTFRHEFPRHIAAALERFVIAPTNATTTDGAGASSSQLADIHGAIENAARALSDLWIALGLSTIDKCTFSQHSVVKPERRPEGYYVDEGRNGILTGRGPAEGRDETMADLREILEDPSTIFWLGAGASWDSGLPLGDAAAKAILQVAFEHCGLADTWERLEAIASDAANDVSWQRFETVLGIFAEYLPAAPGQIVEAFAGIGVSSTHQFLVDKAGKSPRVWLTTNFDDQIERALDTLSRGYRVVSSREEMAALSTDALSRHLVIKLHGDGASLDADQDLGVRIDQILRLLPKRVADSLLNLLAGRPLLFIGYAARDPDLLLFLEALVSSAPKVGWVSLGSPQASVQRFLSACPSSAHYSSGSPTALVDATGMTATPAIAGDVTWREAIKLWASDANRDCLLQGLATVCLQRNDPTARDAVTTVQSEISDSSPQHRLWRLDRVLQVQLRMKTPEPVALQNSTEGLRSLADSPNAPGKVVEEASLSLARYLWQTGQLLDSRRLLQPLVQDGKGTATSANARVRALLQLGMVQVYEGGASLERGIEALDNARALAREADDPILEAEAGLRLAVGLMRAERADQAEQALAAATPVFREIGHPRDLMISSLNMGEALRLQRRFHEALEENGRLLQKAELFGDDEVLMNALGNSALCYAPTGRLLEADNAFVSSHRLAAARGGGEGSGNALYNRGWVRIIVALWEDAMPFLREASQAFVKCGATERTGGTETLIAWCQLRAGRRNAARETLDAIVAKGLRPSPSGLFADDFRMVEFALTNGRPVDQRTVNGVSEGFGASPEQCFYLCHWMLSERHAALPEVDVLEVAGIALDAAERAGMPVYFSVLAESLRGLEGCVPQILTDCNRKSPRPWRELVEDLMSASISPVAQPTAG